VLEAPGQHSGSYEGEISFKTANTERVRIDKSGNVLIGTTTARSGSKVVIDGGTADTFIHLDSDSFDGTHETGIRFSSNTISSTNYFQGEIAFKGNNNYSGDLIFSIAPSGTTNAVTEQMRINSTGDLLINCTSDPSNTVSGVMLRDVSRGACVISRGNASSLSNMISFRNSNGEVGSIKTSGSSTSFNTSSDYRLKENVVTDWDATTRLKQLKPSRFNFIADADTTVDGFLAHEVSSIVPEAISGKKDAVDADGNPEYQGIDQSKLVPLLTKALQEAVAKIETLEAKVTALEAK